MKNNSYLNFGSTKGSVDFLIMDARKQVHAIWHTVRTHQAAAVKWQKRIII